MGFPIWTLIGMGVTGLGALLSIILAYIAQSPRTLTRLGLSGARLDLRVREFTGYGLALLLLAFGFFLAGVPLAPIVETEATTPDVTPTTVIVSNDIVGNPASSLSDGGVVETAVSSTESVTENETPSSGAFDGPPPGDVTATPEAIVELTAIASAAPPVDTEVDDVATATRTPVATGTTIPTGTSPSTSTPTETPTQTATPTLTPTPIDGETAVINTSGSTLWVRRSPGGQTLTLLGDGDIVLVMAGHANQGGIIWIEIQTVDGVLGWIQEEFLQVDDE